MRIYIASDHAGFELKHHLVNFLEENGLDVTDRGPHEYVAGDDYPDYVSLAAEEVSLNPVHARAIVIGLTGQGEAIVANKFKNVRAGVYYGAPYEIITLMREHNDTNVLALGAKFLTPEQAEKMVDLWIDTQFSGDERHQRRIEKISKIESKIESQKKV